MQLNLIPYPKSLAFTGGTAEAGEIRTAFAPDLGAEAYVLTIGTDGTLLEAGSEQGLIWGQNTLAQLKRQFPEGLPCMVISDEPVYPIRSFHLDSSRHMLPLAELKKMVDAASYFKLNTLHWHISDDQGWRIESKVFPRLHELGAYRDGDHFGTYRSDAREGGYFTQEEVKEFVAYCAARGIQVIPEVDLPGHVTAILTAYPELSCRQEKQQVVTRAAITSELLCAGREEVYTFLETLLDELLTLFPAPWFHIGGDEAPKIRWEQCPHCQRKMREVGISTLREFQGYFSNRIAAFLRSRGRRAIVWNDGAYGGNLDPDVVLQVWFPDQDGALQAHGAKGGKMLLSLCEVNYSDYPNGEHPQKGIHQMQMTLPNVPESAIIGGENLLWSEFIRTPERMQELAWPRHAALAEACWTAPRREYEDFVDRLQGLYPVFAEMGIQATPAAGWDPEPEEAARQSREFREQFEAENSNPEYDYGELLSQM